ncbi:MAG: hypothetical protein LBR36_07955 [Bacteroidales bacterium]|jgi:hypothetical protein|nr:hypothetical protein [Bacteroidales bacterium]
MPTITKTQQQDFVNELSRAKKESDVRIVYRNLFKTFYGNQVRIITEEFGTDILIESTDLFYKLKLLAEIKYESDFTAFKTERAKVVEQIIYYLYHFRKKGEILPNILVAADRNELFVIYGPKLYAYLDNDYDWTIKPSESYKYNLELFNELLKDPNLDVFVYNLRSLNFDFNYIFTLIDELLQLNGKFSTIEVSHNSLLKIFEDFNKNVFGGLAIDSKIKMQILFNKFLDNGKVYLHPQKKNIICVITDNKRITEYPLNASQFEAFFSQYNIKDFNAYRQLSEIADTLLEEIQRRFTGDFWTPKIWVDKAHELIENELGSDWKEKYIVWDAAAGTKNLTRDYKFSQLYCSTIHEEEIAISDIYNPEAVTFQYDFLNDDVWLHNGKREITDALKMPLELYNALKEKRPMVFFMNPPYGSNGDNANRSGKRDKEGIAKSKINNIMLDNGIGASAAQELYCQFIYRTQLLAKTFGYETDFHFFYFFNKGFLTSPSFASFTGKLCRQFSFEKGFMFNAGEFNGTSSTWGVIFSHWKLNLNTNPQNKFSFDVLESKNGKIVKKGKWIGKCLNKKDVISNFIISNKNTELLNNGRYPKTKNGIDIPDDKTQSRGKMYKSAFGYFHNCGNNIQFSDKYTGLYSMCFNHGDGQNITVENFEQCFITFAVRKSTLEVFREQDLLWVRDKDIFRRPSEKLQKSKKWTEFVADCVVYSLFASGSNQTALRNYEYNGKQWRVNNEFFWLSKSKITELAVKYGNMATQIDADGDTERFVYQWLSKDKNNISTEATQLLSFATELLEKSFVLRETYAQMYPQYHLNAWDAGWLQIYKMIFSNDRINDSLKDFQNEFKSHLNALGEKIFQIANEDEMI